MLSRRKFLYALGLAVLAVAVTWAIAVADAPRLPAVGEKLPAGTPSEAPRAPADPESGKHLAVALAVTEDRVALDGPPAVEDGWAAGHPDAGTALRVRLYDRRARLLFEAGYPDPLEQRVYGDGSAGPHGTRELAEVDQAVDLPVLPDAAYLVVARDDEVVLRRDLR